MPEARLHATEHELQYLEHIGRHSVTTKNVPVRDLLQLYLSAAAYRSDWGAMDKQIVMAHARQLMKVM